MAPSKEDFQTVLAQARKLVQEQLELTEKVIFGVAKNAPAGINERLESLFQRKGKRIRSTLLCLIAQSGSQKPDSQRVAHACAGIERTAGGVDIIQKKDLLLEVEHAGPIRNGERRLPYSSATTCFRRPCSV